MRLIGALLAGAPLLVLAIAGCGRADSPEGEANVALAEWRVAPSPTAVIGEDEDLPGHVLHQVGGVRLLGDSGVVLWNGGDLEIRVFNPDGRLRHRWGGRGQAPGEFRWIHGMHRLAGDTLLILSPPQLAWLHPDEGVVRQIVYDRPIHDDRCLSSEGSVTLVDGPGLLVGWREMGIPGCPPSPEGRFRRETEYWRVHLETGRIDTLGTFPGEERVGGAPVAHGRRLAALPMGNAVVLGETGGEWIRVYGAGADAVEEWASPFTPREVGNEDVEEWRAVMMDRYQFPKEQVDRELERLPDSLPAFGEFVVDVEGRLWVGRYEPFFASSQEWIALEEGRSVARLVMPEGVRLLDLRDGMAAGLWYDEFGVERVGLFPVSEEGP